MTGNPHSRSTRPAPGLGITPAALFVSLMADQHPEHPSHPVRTSRRRFRSRFRRS